MLLQSDVGGAEARRLALKKDLFPLGFHKLKMYVQIKIFFQILVVFHPSYIFGHDFQGEFGFIIEIFLKKG